MQIVLAIVAAVLAVAAGTLLYGTSRWEVYEGKVKGLRVEGDRNVGATSNPLAHLYLRLFGWQTAAVIDVPYDAATRGYRVGYVPFAGSARRHRTVLHDLRFRMRVGREDPVFFATLASGEEVPLTLVARTDVHDERYDDAPLH